MTRPRRLSNQRFATVAASGTDTAPVAPPTTTPQSRSSCHGAVITVVSDAPVAIVTSAISITRRTPKRSISAAENGAVSPKSRRPSETASEIVAARPAELVLERHDQHARRRAEARRRDQRHERDEHDQPRVVAAAADSRSIRLALPRSTPIRTAAGYAASALAIAAMCSGVEPQQPPTMRAPLST